MQAVTSVVAVYHTHVEAEQVRLASFFGPLRQFNLAHPKSLILLARLF